MDKDKALEITTGMLLGENSLRVKARIKEHITDEEIATLYHLERMRKVH